MHFTRKHWGVLGCAIVIKYSIYYSSYYFTAVTQVYKLRTPCCASTFPPPSRDQNLYAYHQCSHYDQRQAAPSRRLATDRAFGVAEAAILRDVIFPEVVKCILWTGCIHMSLGGGRSKRLEPRANLASSCIHHRAERCLSFGY